MGDHRRLIAQIRETEPGPVTVCLYWHEYRIAPVRRRYERAGFRVICHGYRGQLVGRHRPGLPRTGSSTSCAGTAGSPPTG